ncbi:stalk domain-containing protein [Paenibacillus sp. ACRRY]|uniref:stalk domain-containing protein n=1 Tax=Paenibacillus sp. ACRRY TaxID=2918208 RepID=UPI001EF6754B|nr:stalk domain-containing protein [Paenibacillus sp. ACRRY]MCG7383411.1 copper amine oxidase N-terminal domain-containing protein [Paenibacillus sp. ACRRY]
MKKVAYIAGGILIGFVLSTSAGAFADSVKSLVGKKVSGEYTVIVDGQKLADKGAIIDGKANVPVRGISEALGADIKVSGKTITVTTTDVQQTASPEATAENKYSGRSAESLQETLSILKDRILAPNLKERAEVAADVDRLKSVKADEAVIAERESQLAGYDERIAQANADIAQAEAALAALK